jgi:DNA gyrase subunit A
MLCQTLVNPLSKIDFAMAESPDNPGDPNPTDATDVDDAMSFPGGDLGGSAGGGRIDTTPIERELSDSYLTYAMSTIVDRALPDVRDGLKPSQRRILVAMNDLQLSPGRKHSKCAGIVGETMKKYHPHGDGAIYPTLVNMAQTWKMRGVLIDKQGNFGSMDPDPPAAMRYTEARLHRHAVEMLEDLKLDTVDWQPNFDESVDEPTVLPSKFPNLLINGSTGIAVGMASNMAPHNVGEICDAIVTLIDHPETTLGELFEIVPGPDFPTGGAICGQAGVAQAYATGRGRIVVRAKIDHEALRGGADALIVTEIPFQVTKNDGVISKIVVAQRTDRLTDVSDIIDESSDRSGMRLVIKLKRGADPNVVEKQLYQMTPLQSTFSVINIALVNGQPRTLGMLDLIRYFIDHRREVVRRRTAYRLREAQAEAHRLEGLIYAVCDIDEVIKLIRSSRSRDEAIGKLIARGFRISSDHEYAAHIPERLKQVTAVRETHLTRQQAEAIGRLQLIQLVGLEIEKLVSDYSKLLANIEEYEAILASNERVLQIVRDETVDIKEKYATSRRTTFIEGEVGELNIAELTPVEQVAVTITYRGYVKRLPVEQYRVQRRGGKGVIGASVKDEDFTEHVFVSSTHDDLLCFTNTGRVFKIKVFEIPEARRTNRGRNIINLLELKAGERVCSFMPIRDFEREEAFLVFATANGVVKRTALKDYRNVNRSGLIAINLRKGDTLIGVHWTTGSNDVVLGTAGGMAIRFSEDDARAMGRNASGVKGIDLAKGDDVVGMVVCNDNDERDLLTVTANGYGKRTALDEYLVHLEDGSTRRQSRGGKGRRDIATNARNGKVVGLLTVEPGDGVMLISTGGMIVRIDALAVRHTGRAAQGVRVIKLKNNDTLGAFATVSDDNGDDAGDDNHATR